VIRRLIVVFLMALGLWSCGGEPPPTTRNLVLITMDTTRADHLGCYGYDDVATPNIDHFAARGTVFDRAFATAPITGPSHASILSGTYPPYHQVRDNGVTSVPAEVPWLAQILQERGFETAGIVAAYPVKGVFGFARGFDYFSDILDAPPGSVVITNLHTVGVASRQGEMVSREFELWLDGRDEGPFFVWLHYYDPHWPWEAGAGYADIYPDNPYDAEIAYMDDCIGTVRSALEAAGLDGTTAVILVADHGEGLMDHKELTHALLTYNTTMRVPLVFSIPWIDQVANVISPVSTVDIVPTALEALGIGDTEQASQFQGQTLLPLIKGETGDTATDERTLYFETFYPYFHYGWGVLTGVINGGWKYIKGPDDELYNLETDFDELNPVEDPGIKTAMGERLATVAADLRSGRPESRTLEMDRQAVEMLRSLGYLGGIEPASVDELPNLADLPIPRENMAAYFQHNQVLGLIRSKKYEEATTLCRSIVDRNPTHKDARLLLINLHAMLGNQDEVGRLFEEVLEDFRDADVLFQAGLYYLSRGDHGQATTSFEEVVDRDPADFEALTALGMVYSQAGDLDRAREHFEAALAVNPKHREALIRLGALLQRQEQPESGIYFERAVQHFPFDPEVNFNYGIFLFRTGEEAGALEYLKRASALADGKLFEPAHFAMASYFAQMGDVESARRYLREIVLQTNNPEMLNRAQAMLESLG